MIITLFVFLFLRTCICDIDLEKYEELYIEGTALLESNKLFEGIEKLNEAVQSISPKNRRSGQNTTGVNLSIPSKKERPFSRKERLKHFAVGAEIW